MMKLVTTEAVTHIQCNLINNKRAEDKAALLWIY